jgi:hypothetical protein
LKCHTERKDLGCKNEKCDDSLKRFFALNKPKSKEEMTFPKSSIWGNVYSSAEVIFWLDIDFLKNFNLSFGLLENKNIKQKLFCLSFEVCNLTPTLCFPVGCNQHQASFYLDSFLLFILTIFSKEKKQYLKDTRTLCSVCLFWVKQQRRIYSFVLA